MNKSPIGKALHSIMSGNRSGTASKKQKATQDIGFLHKVAEREGKSSEGYYKKYGSFEDRLKKLADSRK